MTTSNDCGDNRRRFRRVLFDAPVTLTDANGDHSSSVVDISLKGALIAQPAGWNGAVGDRIKIDIQLDGTSRICMQGAVAHIEEGRLGIRCDQIDIDSISHLRRLAELNLGDAELVERELEALG
ncbi:MAG TPA: PilZ domain-containing protein [Sedimenticola sp.]|nr:PilZ domain-containing protein [Sedimenticola sp.]